MAATRPVVLVFQEFATLSSSPATPELNVLVAGPAYWIQDFPEDRANIQIADYGITPGSAASGAAVVTTAVVVSDAPNNKVGAILDTASVRVNTSKTQVELAYANDMTTTVGSPAVGSSSTDFVAAGVAVLDTLVMTDLAGPTTLTRTIVAVSANSLTLNSETPAGYSASGVKFRIERTLPESKIDASHYTFVPATNSIQVNALTTLPVGSSQKRIVSCELYVSYRSLRQDLADVKTLGGVNEVEGQLGKIDSRNPLAAGVFVTLQNTNTTVQYFGISTDDLAGYTAMKDAIGSRKDVYAVVPLSSDILVLAMLKSEFAALADPDFALTNGIPQKFRVAIGSSAQLPVSKIVIDTNTDGNTQVDAALSSPTTHHTLTVPGVDLIGADVQPGDTFRVLGTGTTPAAGGDDTAAVPRTGDFIVAQVLSATSLVLETEPPGGAQSGNADIQILVGSTVGVRLAQVTVTGLATIVDAQLYLDLYDPNGTFVDDGVIPTDLIEMPRNPTQTSFTDKDIFEVALVVSNQRVRIVNNGRSTSLVANELPHGASRNSPVTLIPNTNTQTYRVTRTLDKAGQVTELVAVTQSLASRRVVNVYPDLCDVGGLVDGSLPRDPAAPTVAQPAASQPGFYLACAVGGMTAGLPSHQGFTNLGIAGISKIYHSNTYFSDKNITDISNGGWFVFQQDTPQALPYCIHQLTTDPSTLQSGEFSMVKNFDFVSIFFSDIVDDFIGTWNVNPETIGFIAAGIVGGVDNLKLRRRPRIGAPIIDGKITSIAQSTSSADRVETFVEITFPAPLNTVALHLVSA